MVLTMAVKTQLQFTQIDQRTWLTVGSTGSAYTLKLVARSLRCNCFAGLRGKHCYHVSQLVDSFKAEINESISYQDCF